VIGNFNQSEGVPVTLGRHIVGVEALFHLFLTSALDGWNWST